MATKKQNRSWRGRRLRRAKKHDEENQMTRAEKVRFINRHRKATCHHVLKDLSDEEIHHHLVLIDENAPYGEDPWSNEP